MSKPTWGQQFGREISRLLYLIPYLGWVVGIVSFIVFLARKDHRALHDLIGGTVVLYDPNLLFQMGQRASVRS